MHTDFLPLSVNFHTTETCTRTTGDSRPRDFIMSRSCRDRVATLPDIENQSKRLSSKELKNPAHPSIFFGRQITI